MYVVLAAPKGLPEDVRQRLGEAVDALRDNKDFNAFLVEKLRMRPVDYGADAARRYMEEASARYAEEAARP